MLTSEQKAIFANIKSLVTQIDQVEGGEEQSDEIIDEEVENQEQKSGEKFSMKDSKVKKVVKKEDIKDKFITSESDDTEDEDIESDELAMKAIQFLDTYLAEKAETDNSGNPTTADDSAEDRMNDDEPEQNKENVDEVTKAIMALGSRLKNQNSKAVAKSKVTSNDKLSRIEKSVEKLTNVLSTMVDNHDQVAKAVEGILEGFGISEQINQRKAEVKKSFTNSLNRRVGVPRNRPVQNTTVQKEMDYIEGADEEEEEDIEDGSIQKNKDLNKVRKSLSGALPSIFGFNKQ